MMRRVVLGMLALGLIGVGAAPAAAAPSGGERFEIVCEGEPILDVHLGPGQGIWTPAFVVGTNQRVIPFAIEGTFVRPDPHEDIEVDAFKKAPKHDRVYEDCSFDQGGFGGLTGVNLVSFTLTPG